MTARLAVRVQPKASRPGMVGRGSDGSLRVRVTEPPEDGRANRAVESLLAKELGVAKKNVTVVRGATARAKWVEIVGLSAAELEARVRLALVRCEERDDD